MNIIEIEEKIRHLLGKCQQLEQLNTELHQKLACMQEKCATLETQKARAIEQVEQMMMNLKRLAGV